MATEFYNQEVLAQENSQQQPAFTGYQKILVAVDYLDSASEVFKQALGLAKVNSSRLKLFHCLQGRLSEKPALPIYAELAGYSGIYSQEMLDLNQKLLEESTQELKAWLGGFVQQAFHQGLEAETDCCYGEPGRQICTTAQNWGADLIIVGRRGRTGLSELLLGSVSNYVIHHAACSVLVIQQRMTI